MAAEQTNREWNFLILFSILNFNRSMSARLLLTTAEGEPEEKPIFINFFEGEDKGLKILNSDGTFENTGGDDVRGSNIQLSVKPEATPIAFGVGG